MAKSKKYVSKYEGTYVYPKDLNTGANDYIQFCHSKYKVNDALNGYTASKKEDRFFERGHGIQLYMPNSTPGTPNNQGWASQTFPGDVGVLSKRLLAFSGGGAGLSGGNSPGLQRQGDLSEVFRQNLLQGIAQEVGQDASAALQLGKGQVYNPNVEMMYKMPLLRQFNFNFDFIPKNSEETSEVDKIISEFKKWSSPTMAKGDGKFLGLPDLWNITYFEGGTTNGKVMQYRGLNKFKFCVLESVKVVENPKSNYHMTIDDPAGPAPVHTSLSLIFTETDIITREDHEKAEKDGYLRGY